MTGKKYSKKRMYGYYDFSKIGFDDFPTKWTAWFFLDLRSSRQFNYKLLFLPDRCRSVSSVSMNRKIISINNCEKGENIRNLKVDQQMDDNELCVSTSFVKSWMNGIDGFLSKSDRGRREWVEINAWMNLSFDFRFRQRTKGSIVKIMNESRIVIFELKVLA